MAATFCLPPIALRLPLRRLRHRSRASVLLTRPAGGGSTSCTTWAFPATQAGDCIIFAGCLQDSIAGLQVKTNNNDNGTFGTLGGVTTRWIANANNRYSFHGIIASPTVGSTSVTMSYTGGEECFSNLSVWVVRALSSPVQDKGVWTPLEADPVSVSGLTGTLADANEFAISQAQPPNLVKAANENRPAAAGS